MAEFTVIASSWNSLIKRIERETQQRIGDKGRGFRPEGFEESAVVAIKAVIFVDCNGTPIHWMVESSNVEPASRAKGLIDILT